ncbi:hypothetical protein OUZ56_008257 [Daphnia magna]|uniref:Uncharacterized protein n=1 Tax=Daphnia magna TaxID=35525 RepID=A0ABR0ACV0_9CRUS|nr:hypothetical protein OUZ56_008257 [Daphnia magna]
MKREYFGKKYAGHESKQMAITKQQLWAAHNVQVVFILIVIAHTNNLRAALTVSGSLSYEANKIYLLAAHLLPVAFVTQLYTQYHRVAFIRPSEQRAKTGIRPEFREEKTIDFRKRQRPNNNKKQKQKQKCEGMSQI